MGKRRLRWDKATLDAFGEAIRYIRKKSPQNAENVKSAILAKVREVAERPEMHPPDKYKQNNDGRYRSFELHHYRVSYLVKEDEIIIARFRHTAQAPENY